MITSWASIPSAQSRSAITTIPDSRLQVCEDLFEDHGLGDPGVKLKLTSKIRGDCVTADFTGSGGSERHQRHLLVSQRVKDTLEELHRSDRTRCRELALGGHLRWSVGREIPTRDSE